VGSMRGDGGFPLWKTVLAKKTTLKVTYISFFLHEDITIGCYVSRPKKPRLEVAVRRRGMVFKSLEKLKTNQMYQKPLDRLRIFSLKGVQMRTFHITWLMFFVCFFGWFGLAPLMPTIRTDLGLSRSRVGNLIIASVASTVVARLVVGRLCDLWG